MVGGCDGGRVSGEAPVLPLAPASVPKTDFDSPAFAALMAHTPMAPLAMQPEEPALFLYTSGSTGRPKGVVLSHFSHLWAMASRARWPGPAGQRSLVAAPLYHMNGLASCQAIFSQGDAVVLLPQFTTRSYIETAA